MSKESARAWLESALADLKSIEYIKGDDFLTHMAAFHAQQCVEKCFKATLEYTGQRVLKAHSTLKLYGLVKNELPVDFEIDMLTDLDDLYIESRYPGDLGLLPHGKPTKDESREFFEFAQYVFDMVKKHLQ
ncbi:HEPN domain-containing protein [Desulfonatronospira sp.]|uniref:HEPN domain-containing protein n=1 Tax=Desulfonatronospira sp. TaxID=1962951 RepID=UPI0025BF82BC|nr:HEPN domain-containing protein [Desulfonatronospira sp.]